MTRARLRLRGIVVSTRAAMDGHPDDAERIVGVAESLLDQLQADLEAEGDPDNLLAELAEARGNLRTG